MDEFLRQPLHPVIEGELFLHALLIGQLPRVLFQDPLPRVRQRVDRVTHAIDQAGAVKGFPIQNLLQIRRQFRLIRPVAHMLLEVGKHVLHLQVRAAVLRAF